MKILDSLDARAAGLEHLEAARTEVRNHDHDLLVDWAKVNALASLALACFEARHNLPTGPIARDQ